MAGLGRGPASSSWPLGVSAEQWIACSAGHGAKGRRLYDWTRIQLATPATAGMARWLLVRRSQATGKLAFYACYGPVATPLVGLVRVAGTKWAVEEGFEQAKGEVGLDHYEVRKWPGWCATSPWRCWPMRSWPSPRAQASQPPRAQRGGHCSVNGGLGLLPLTVPEVPPPAGRAGVDGPRPAPPRTGLVQVVPTPSGPR